MGIYDFTCKDFLYKTSDDMAVDSKGNFHMRLSDNMTMDVKTGKLHFTSTWESSDDSGSDDSD